MSGAPLVPGRFLLPAPGVDLAFWPVIAVDQYTSNPELWRAQEARVGDRPSALRLVLPEAFLSEGEASREARVRAAHRAMEAYLSEGILSEAPPGMVLVERVTPSGARPGLLLLADLQAYDFAPGNRAPVRATEETVLDRIPPRLALREAAFLELSHTLLLTDDPGDRLIGPLYARRHSLPLLYDTELPMEGGRLRGWSVAGDDLAPVLATLVDLREQAPPGAMLFAVGDGNHSFAAAKTAWERLRPSLSPGEARSHPMRFAMAELIHLRTPALLLEPIHRVLFGADGEDVLRLLAPLRPEKTGGPADLTLLTRQGEQPLRLALSPGQTPVEALQPLLDKALQSSCCTLDYIHGDGEVRRLVREQGAAGLLLPPFEKDALFPLVERLGRLPRKAFSLGHANEKRFYMEARRLR